MKPQQVPHASGVVTGFRAYRLPVRRRILVSTSSGHEVGVEHVYWVPHVEARLAPGRAAPKSAARLLRRCCERLVLPEVALDEACRLLTGLVAAAIDCTNDGVRVELSADRRAIRLRVTARNTSYVDIGGTFPPLGRADIRLAHPSAGAWTVSRSDTATVVSTLVAVTPPNVTDLAS